MSTRLKIMTGTRFFRFVAQLFAAAASVWIADRYSNSWVLLPNSFLKPAELTASQLGTILGFIVGCKALLIALFTLRRNSPVDNPIRLLVELTVAVCATSLGGLYMFVFTIVPFNPNFYFLIYVLQVALYAGAYLVASIRRGTLASADPGAPRFSAGMVGLVRSPWSWLAVIIAITPGLLAVGYKKNRDFGDFINRVRASMTYGGTSEWELVDLYPGVTWDQPMEVAFGNNSSGDVYYLSRPGRLIRLNPSESVEGELLVDLTDRVASIEFELGALSFALHPEYGQEDSPNRGFVYLWFTRLEVPAQFNLLSRFDLSLPTLAERNASELILMDIKRRPSRMHNGGTAQFGSDGFLYLSVGDSMDNNLSQRIDDSLLSGILRIDVDNQGGEISRPITRQPRDGKTANYSIPVDNPWFDEPDALQEFWAIGFRNPFRMWVDNETGAAWVGDVGFESWEEFSRIEKGGNGQWDFREGPEETRFGSPDGPVLGVETPPFYTYRQTSMDRAALGGLIYRGSKYPQLYGMYVFGDNNSAAIRMLDPSVSDPEPTMLAQASQFGQQGPTSIGVTPDDELFVTVLGSKNGADGQVQVIRPRTSDSPDASQNVLASMSVADKYIMVCARCHGDDGRGMLDTASADGMPPRPDFRKSEWQQLRDDAWLATVILDGGTAVGLTAHMPPWRGFLTEKEAVDMVAHLRGLNGTNAE
jgi:Glucose / Sorbosone dehydrogenase/Cytochrome C oxidase, cbb3-type, subunit III